MNIEARSAMIRAEVAIAGERRCVVPEGNQVAVREEDGRHAPAIIRAPIEVSAVIF